MMNFGLFNAFTSNFLYSGEAGGAGVAGLETGGPQKMCHHDDHDHDTNKKSGIFSVQFHTPSFSGAQ